MNNAVGTHGDPFFFGDRGHQIYGCYHTAAPDRERDVVVVIVPTIGQEYIRCHRSLRLLADRLAASGLSCLRFDLFGTGHSAGDDEDCSLSGSLKDIRRAVDVARERAMTDRVALLGVRMGASLAALYGSVSERMSLMVLWDPVVRGDAHLRELAAAHEELTRRRSSTREGRATQLLGFKFSEQLVAEIRALDLAKLPSAPAERLLLLESTHFGDGAGLRAHLDRINTNFEPHRVPGRAVWLRSGLQVVVANDIINAAYAWLSGATL